MTWPIFSAFFLTALYLQEIYHLSPIWAGLAFAPQTIVFGLTGIFVTPRIMKWVGPKKTVLIGLPFLFVSFIFFAFLPVTPNYVFDILPAMFLFGIGGTLASLPLSHVAMSGVQKSDAGLASGLINTSRQVGGDVGIALVGSIAAAYTASLLSQGTTEIVALVKGYNLGFAINGIILIIPLIAALRFKTTEADLSAPTIEEQQMSDMEIAELM